MGILKRPHLPEIENYLPQNAASAAMVLAGGRQKVIKRAYEIKSKDQVRTLTTRERLRRVIQQINGELISFRTLVRSTKLLHWLRGLNHGARQL